MRQALYQRIFAEAQVPVIICDGITRRILECNAAGLALFGYAAGDLANLKLEDLLGTVDAGPWDELARRAHQTLQGEMQIFEWLCRRRDGSPFWSELTWQLVQDDELSFLLVFVRDIDDHQRLAEQLNKERQFLRTIIDSVPDDVFIKDRQSRFILANTHVLQRKHMSMEQLMGRSDFDMFDAAEATQFYSAEQRLMDRDEPLVSEENLLIDRRGQKRWFLSTKVPLHDHTGQVVGLVGINRDITRIKEDQEELAKYRLRLEDLVQQRTRQLEEANHRFHQEMTERLRLQDELMRVHNLESLSQLADGFGNNFNNLLMTILGSLAMSRVLLTEQNPAAANLNHIEEAAEQARQLTKRLLAFSRNIELNRHPTALPPLMKRLAEQVVASTEVRFSLNAPPQLWDALVDEEQIEQALHSVLENAVRAVPPKGIIQIELDQLEIGKGHQSPLAPGKYVRVTIRDNGCGIEPDLLPRIFDPYFTTRSEATGLGLALTHMIITRHNGDIVITSEPGQGTSVALLLPSTGKYGKPRAATAPGDEAPAMVSAEVPTISSEIPRILILDDETLVGETLLQMLTHLGYQATLTETEEAALDAWRKAREDHHPFAVAMVDLSLRGEHDGGDVFKRLRKLDPDARAILMSGQLNAPLMHQFQQLGFSAMVAKPFRMEEINRLLRQVIASGTPAESAASAPPGKVP